MTVYVDGQAVDVEVHIHGWSQRDGCIDRSRRARPVKLVMTSRDVIHSFYVPAFRNKQDVLPGRYTTLWFQATAPGDYPVYCAEYCGISHSMMRGTVSVLTADAYARWLGAPTRDASGQTDLVSYGAKVAAKRECIACHTTTGQRHIGPSWAGLYGSWVTMNDGRSVVADEEYLTRSMMEPNADVVADFKSVMPAYFGILPQPETAALVEYIKIAPKRVPSTSGNVMANGAELSPLPTLPTVEVRRQPRRGPPGSPTPVLRIRACPSSRGFHDQRGCRCSGRTAAQRRARELPRNRTHRRLVARDHRPQNASVSSTCSRSPAVPRARRLLRAPPPNRAPHPGPDHRRCAMTYNRLFTLHGVTMGVALHDSVDPRSVRELPPPDHDRREGMSPSRD